MWLKHSHYPMGTTDQRYGRFERVVVRKMKKSNPK
jgi:hypothetical protein